MNTSAETLVERAKVRSAPGHPLAGKAAFAIGAGGSTSQTIPKRLAGDRAAVAVHHSGRTGPAVAPAAGLTAAGGKAVATPAGLPLSDAASDLSGFAAQHSGGTGIVVANGAALVRPLRGIAFNNKEHHG